VLELFPCERGVGEFEFNDDRGIPCPENPIRGAVEGSLTILEGEPRSGLEIFAILLNEQLSLLLFEAQTRPLRFVIHPITDPLRARATPDVRGIPRRSKHTR